MPVTFDIQVQTLRFAPAILISTILHTVVLIVLALLFISASDRRPMTIVVLNEQGLSEAELMTDSIEIESELTPDQQPIDLSLASAELPTSDFGELASVSLLDGLDGLGIEEGLTGDFGDKINHARLYGLDIVLVFDSTGSMSAEIDAVKQRIHSIGTTLLEKIPSTRISLVTYRDRTRNLTRKDRRLKGRSVPRSIPQADFVVQGIPLTNQLTDFDRFLIGISAKGGGDRPEAVLDGLEWAMDRNDFSAKSLKVILVFGDAPPHREDLNRCLKLARAFRKRDEGTVSTITCRNPTPLPEFYEIARAGGGEAHTLANTRWLLEELLVLAFGSEHRENVLEFFGLEGEG